MANPTEARLHDFVNGVCFEDVMKRAHTHAKFDLSENGDSQQQKSVEVQVVISEL